MFPYANLFTPVTIGSVTIKNRFALAPMGPLGLCDADGGFNQRGIDYYTERAKGGTGLIITGVTFVDNHVEEHGMPNVPCPTHNDVHFVRTAREMTERIHAYDAKVFLQMSGGFGRVTIPTNLGEYPPVAPSAIPHRWLDKICRPLTVEEIHEIVKKFGKDFTFKATQVIGLTNDDAVSTEHRPFKQMIERLNRTYKASYRHTNGFDNIDGANYDLALWVAYYNFLRPHKHNKYKVLNEVEMLQGADNMPGKWQLLIFLGQQTILNMQKNGTATPERSRCQ